MNRAENEVEFIHFRMPASMDMKAKGEYSEVLSAFGELVGNEQDLQPYTLKSLAKH